VMMCSKSLSPRGEAVDRRDAVVTQWGNWLETIAEWDHFATLTFNFDATVQSAVRYSRGWLRWCERRAQQRVDWFYVVEGGGGSLVHVHSLMVGTVGVKARDLETGWLHGIAQVVPYAPAGGAAQYVAKSLADEQAVYDLRVKAALLDETGHRHGY
jgi:hypothetical protein